jgi:hypothetical protein
VQSKEQRAKSKEQRAEGKEQRAKSKEQRAAAFVPQSRDFGEPGRTVTTATSSVGEEDGGRRTEIRSSPRRMERAG